MLNIAFFKIILFMNIYDMMQKSINWARDVNLELFRLGLGEFWMRQDFINTVQFMCTKIEY